MAGVPERSLHLEIRLLGKIPNADSLRAGNRARAGFVGARDDSQERRLADAVWTHQANARAFVNRKGQPRKEVCRAERFRKGVYVYQRHFVEQQKIPELRGDFLL